MAPSARRPTHQSQLSGNAVLYPILYPEAMRRRLGLLFAVLCMSVALTMTLVFLWTTSRYCFLWWYDGNGNFVDIQHGAFFVHHFPKEKGYGVRGTGLHLEWDFPLTIWEFEGDLSDPKWWRLTVPLWSLTGLSFLASAFTWWRFRRLLRRLKSGSCSNCGYSCTGLPSAMCPECGQRIHSTPALISNPVRSSLRGCLKWSATLGAVTAFSVWIASAWISVQYHLQFPYDAWILAWAHIDVDSGAIDYAYGYGKTPGLSNGLTVQIERIRPFRWWFAPYRLDPNANWPKRTPEVIPLWIFALVFAVPAAWMWIRDRTARR